MTLAQEKQAVRAQVDGTAWAAAQSMGRFTAWTLAASAQRTVDDIETLLLGWLDEGLVAAAGVGLKKRTIYRVVDQTAAVAGNVTAQRAVPVGTAQGNMWNAMKGQRSFTPTDIASMSHTSTVSVSLEDATAYCQMLARAGYLAVIRKARPPKVEAAYRLTNWTGPRPPVLRRLRAVVDQNTNTIAHVVIGVSK